KGGEEGYGNVKPYRIIGVVKDFHYSSLRENIGPVVMVLGEDWSKISVRVSTNNLTATMDQIKIKWHGVAPNLQPSFSFMNRDFDATYRVEQQIGQIFIVFTTLAIIIACLGLFGLAAYAAEQRTKEIGIRKILGASVSVIVGMLSKDFLKLVLLAIIIASPIAWYLMQQWLQDFAYRVDIKWWVVLVSGGAASLVAFLTIGFQSVKAALINPVKSLRSE
ncbi:MAG: FtsX-like permease family protein, partial [Sphingobacteriales bacterium]